MPSWVRRERLRGPSTEAWALETRNLATFRHESHSQRNPSPLFDRVPSRVPSREKQTWEIGPEWPSRHAIGCQSVVVEYPDGIIIEADREHRVRIRSTNGLHASVKPDRAVEGTRADNTKPGLRGPFLRKSPGRVRAGHVNDSAAPSCLPKMLEPAGRARSTR